MAARRRTTGLLESSQAYEAWVDDQMATVASARADKHSRMAADPFGFLRATYWRWVQRVAVLADEPPGPVLLGVGDLHVENLGTWRDGESRQVWGINDTDEADRIPAAHDLLRLVTSALLADRQGAIRLSAKAIVSTLLEGYGRAAAAGGRPIVLDRPDPEPLGPLLPPEHEDRWWQRLDSLHPVGDLPDDARQVLMAALPAGAGPVTLFARVAGMGSRDHLRVVARADLAGAPAVRELKALARPATRWLSPSDDPAGAAGAGSAELLATAKRSADPAVHVTSPWVVRRLAPWSDCIELADLHRRVDAMRLIHAMGAETANLHLGSGTPDELARLTTKKAVSWFESAAKRMLSDTLDDWKTWRRAMKTVRRRP